MQEMPKINKPFSKEQVNNLNAFQNHGMFHPFTCCSAPEVPQCQRRSRENDGELIATEDGWICPCGGYRQDWAHKFMAEPQPSPKEIIKKLEDDKA